MPQNSDTHATDARATDHTISPDLIDRMVTLVRRLADKVAYSPEACEAHAIAKLLPAPVDPDVSEAAALCRATGWMPDTSLVTDGGSGMQLAFKAIKRGRELEAGK